MANVITARDATERFHETGQPELHFTRHARQRMQQRAIPPGVVELIQDFGQSWDAGNGATSHALTKQSFREIKRSYGRSIAEALAPYRNAYVIAQGALVITAARTNCARFD